MVEVLRERFPGLDAPSLAKVLLLAAERGKVSYEETVGDELLLFAEEERLLLPVRTSRSLAWEDRALILKPGEEYEMPTVVRHLVLRAAEVGDWDPEYAVGRYLEEIGEAEVERVLDLLYRVLEGGRWTGRVSAEQLRRYAEEVGLPSSLSRLIAELKGGGVISPCLRASLPSGPLQYEINPSLYREPRDFNRGSRWRGPVRPRSRRTPRPPPS